MQGAILAGRHKRSLRFSIAIHSFRSQLWLVFIDQHVDGANMTPHWQIWQRAACETIRQSENPPRNQEELGRLKSVTDGRLDLLMIGQSSQPGWKLLVLNAVISYRRLTLWIVFPFSHSILSEVRPTSWKQSFCNLWWKRPALAYLSTKD